MARHRRRRGPSNRTLLVAGTAFGLVLGGGLIALAAIPLAKGPPTLVLSVESSPASTTFPSLPFPAQGESALSIPTLHVAAATKDQASVPIASVTKLMTAYVALAALPLTTTESGPSIVVTDDDVAEYHHDLKTDQSNVKVVEGEVLTERQLLDGMLVHSANNYASILSRMVAGSDDAMVERMNATAVALRMTKSSYVDVSGFDPDSKSSAVDVLHLAILLMKNPTFAQIVAQTSVVLPVAGRVTTYTPYLGKPGVVGIKTGSTLEALGCDVMAFDVSRAGQTVQIIDVVLGQSSVIPGRTLVKAAGHAALVLASAAAHHISVWQVTRANEPTGILGWPSSGVPVAAVTSIAVPTFDGGHATSTLTDGTWPANGAPQGATVATVFVTSGAYSDTTTFVTTATLTRPSLWQRLR